MTMEIFGLFLALGAMALLSTIAWAALSLAPWVPTHRRDLARIARTANITASDVVYELGCGNGRVSLALARACGCRVVGIELAWPLYALCKLRQWTQRMRGVSFRWQNIFRANVSSASVVYVFGLPRTVQGAFRDKLQRELRPGARVVSYAFAIEGWEPALIDRPRATDIPIYLYIR